MAEASPDTDADPLEPRSEEITAGDELVFRPPPEDFPFRTLLLDISTQISDADLQAIKYQYRGELKFGVAEKIQTALELFDVLEKRGYIQQAAMIHLQKIVMMISDESVRQDLMLKIYEYSEKHKSIYFRKPTEEPENGYRRVKFHIIAPSGSKFKRLNRRQIQDLVNAVAMYTGVDGSDIRVLGIESSNSIYVTLLLPEKHCDILVLLVKKGFTILTEMRVDIVSFDDNISIEVSTGKVVEDEIPPTYGSLEQKVQCLEENLAKIQKENINYARQITELNSMLIGEISDDIEGKMKEFDDVMTDIRRTDSDDKRFNRAVSLNTCLVRSVEKKRFEATEIKMKSDIMCLKAELLEYKHGVKVAEETGIDAVLKENQDKQHIKSTSHSETPMPKDMGGFLLNRLNRATQRAYDMGCRKPIIRDIVSASIEYIKHTAIKQKQKELDAVVQEKRIQEALFKQTLPAHNLKGAILTQFETIFKTAGKIIPCDEGYKVEVVKLAMETSNAISDEERLKLECGHTDLCVTEPIRNEKKFLLLRLLYLENIESDLLIPLESFVRKQLSAIARDDLQTKWEKGLKNVGQRAKINPDFGNFLRNVSLKLSNEERQKLRKKLPLEENCGDEELLVRLMEIALGSDPSVGEIRVLCDYCYESKNDIYPGLISGCKYSLKLSETLTQSLSSIFIELDRTDLSEEFAKYQQTKTKDKNRIRQEWLDVLKETSMMLPKTDKKKLIKKLKDKSKCKVEDDVLGCLVNEQFEFVKLISIGLLKTFMEKELSAIGQQQVYEAFEKLVKKKLQQQDQILSLMMAPLLGRMDRQSSSDPLILQKLHEMDQKIETLLRQQTSPGNTYNLMSAVVNYPLTSDELFDSSHIYNLGKCQVSGLQ